MRASARVALYYGKQKRFMGVLFGGKKKGYYFCIHQPDEGGRSGD